MAAASSHHDAAARLRRRALALRTLARRLSSLEVLQLHRHADSDVWMGPSQQRLAIELQMRRRALTGAIEALQTQARRFDREADALALLPEPGGLR